MEKFTTLTGLVVPLDRSNVDTDAIIPKQFLKSIYRTGYGPNCFDEWRYLDKGEPGMDNSKRPVNPDFVLNFPRYKGAEILLARKNFGCGSSREHAVWGLMQFGIRAVVAAGFGEIFYSNCFNNGLLAAKVTPEDAAQLLSVLSDAVPVSLIIDLPAQTISAAGGLTVPFTVAERHKTMLLEGLDMLEATIKDKAAIEAFRREHEAAYPWMAGLPGKARRLRG